MPQQAKPLDILGCNAWRVPMVDRNRAVLIALEKHFFTQNFEA